jgi:hypothetical protein
MKPPRRCSVPGLAFVLGVVHARLNQRHHVVGARPRRLPDAPRVLRARERDPLRDLLADKIPAVKYCKATARTRSGRLEPLPSGRSGTPEGRLYLADVLERRVQAAAVKILGLDLVRRVHLVRVRILGLDLVRRSART